MNVVALVHLLAGIVAIAVSIPLIRGKVKMNPWYGIRVPAAFESEERWIAINRYGGTLFLRWGVVICVIALCGLPLSREWWVSYNLAALLPILGGLVMIVAFIYRYARER